MSWLDELEAQLDQQLAAFLAANPSQEALLGEQEGIKSLITPKIYVDLPHQMQKGNPFHLQKLLRIAGNSLPQMNLSFTLPTNTGLEKWMQVAHGWMISKYMSTWSTAVLNSLEEVPSRLQFNWIWRTTPNAS